MPVSNKNKLLIGLSGVLALTAEVYAYLAGSERSWVVFTLAILAIVLSGMPTFKKGLHAIRTFTLNINFLMMIAIAGAFLIGEWPEAAMVTVLFTLAELIEDYSLEKARHAIEGLIRMVPNEATYRANIMDPWQIKPIAEIQIGHTVWVKPGERIPLDGIVTKGHTTLNQAPVTGESMPVEKTVGDMVYAGTLNERGSIEFKVTANAQNTVLAKIIHTIEAAQAERAPTQKFVDQFAKYYTPIMVILAILIAILPPLVMGASFYPWINKALVLLVIACPCALVISTPITVVSGLTVAARHGLLIKGGIYLENGYKLKVMAFDKTGTLTQGKPIVTDALALQSYNQMLLLKMAASLDVHSKHPVAQAIVTHWQEMRPNDLYTVERFEAIIGRGATGIIDGQRYYIGNHQLAEDNHVCTPAIEAQLAQLEKAGKTTVILSTDQTVLGIIAVADTVRATSKTAIEALRELGITTVMITGDNATTAQAIGQSVGINTIEANMLPEAKLLAINELLQQYHHVGMVGDGINDTPALAKASIGFAMGIGGSDTALETADVAIMEDNLNKLPLFIQLSRKTSHILLQNISIAIGVKAVFFTLALLGIATLWMAVFADMGASLIVVFNALQLLNFKGTISCCNKSHALN